MPSGRRGPAAILLASLAPGEILLGLASRPVTGLATAKPSVELLASACFQWLRIPSGSRISSPFISPLLAITLSSGALTQEAIITASIPPLAVLLEFAGAVLLFFGGALSRDDVWIHCIGYEYLNGYPSRRRAAPTTCVLGQRHVLGDLANVTGCVSDNFRRVCCVLCGFLSSKLNAPTSGRILVDGSTIR